MIEKSPRDEHPPWKGQAQAPRTAGAGGGGGGGGAQLDLAPQDGDGVHKYAVAVAALEDKDVGVAADICKRNSHLKLCYNLRNRNVFVPNTNKPQLGPLHTKKPQLGSLQYKKGKEHVYDVSGQTPTCAKVALEHYNRSNEDEYEMVKALDSVSSFFNGVWVHVNFLAKLKGATQCPDLVPKFFFAEVKRGPDGMSCVSCVKIDPGSPEATPIRGCGICLNNAIYHPAAGGHRGDRKNVCQMHTLWRSL
uniref:DUF3615 domain-containing protein n=1 Tax=Oryza glumipatula TaxID=40148 RepID=A0A0D9Z5W7_9ORYZ